MRLLQGRAALHTALAGACCAACRYDSMTALEMFRSFGITQTAYENFLKPTLLVGARLKADSLLEGCRDWPAWGALGGSQAPTPHRLPSLPAGGAVCSP